MSIANQNCRPHTPPLKEVHCGRVRILITPDTMVSDMMRFYENWDEDSTICDVFVMRNCKRVFLDLNLSLFEQVQNKDKVFVVEHRNFLYDVHLRNQGVNVYVKKDESTLIRCFVLGDRTLKELLTFGFNLTNVPTHIEHSKLFWTLSNSNKLININEINCRYLAKYNKVIKIC